MEIKSRLETAVRLRKSGDGEVSRALLLELVSEQPDNCTVLYQCAWTHDSLGREREAVGFYERAIAAGLSGPDLASASLGLGSTLRGLGEYERAVQVLEAGVALFPEDRGLRVFLAMAHYNANRPKESASSLLRILMETSSDPAITGYRRAVLMYADDLDRIWES